MKTYDIVEIEIIDERDQTLEESPVFKVTFDRCVDYDIDNDYGADADGNRGVSQVFIDDDQAENISVDGKPLKECPEDVQKIVNEGIALWMEEHEPVIETDEGEE